MAIGRDRTRAAQKTYFFSGEYLMDDDEQLAEAVVELQTRLAFHEDGQHHIDRVVAGLQSEVATLQRQVATMAEQLRQLQQDVERRRPDERPPHY